MMSRARLFVRIGLAFASVMTTGCGTSRWSDSKRTATEQMLVSDAVERAVMLIDMRPLAGQSVFLDTAILDEVNDGKYLTSALKHQLLASGCQLAADKENATVIVEARAGAIGTDRNDFLLGLPTTSVSLMGTGATIPEIAAYKRTDQRGVAKVNLFAIEKATGRPIWQSGLSQVKSKTRDRWVAGAGPFQKGDITDGIEYAGEGYSIPGQGTPSAQQTAKRTEAERIAGRTDLRVEKLYATLPLTGSPAEQRPVTADQRPVNLPPVR